MARSPRRGRHGRRVLAALLIGGILLAGCSGDDDAAVEDVEEGAPPAAGEGARQDMDGAGDEAGGAEAAEDGGDDGSGQVDDVPAVDDRQRIVRASVGLASDDPDATADAVEQAAVDADGFVAGTRLHRDEDGILRGSITVRVPAANFRQLVDDVEAAAAEVTSRDRTVEDVTGVVADVEARLRNLRALEEELLVLLTEARVGGTTEDVLAIFDRVGQVREEIEVLEGRRAELGDQVALSTLDVQVEPSATLLAEVSSEPDQDLPLPWSPGNVATNALDATVTTVQAFVDLVIRVALYLLPVLLVWLSPVWLALLAAWWWRRRRSTPGDGTTGGDPVGPDRPRGDGDAEATRDGTAVPAAPVAPTGGSGDDDREREPVGATTAE